MSDVILLFVTPKTLLEITDNNLNFFLERVTSFKKYDKRNFFVFSSHTTLAFPIWSQAFFLLLRTSSNYILRIYSIKKAF